MMIRGRCAVNEGHGGLLLPLRYQHRYTTIEKHVRPQIVRRHHLSLLCEAILRNVVKFSLCSAMLLDLTCLRCCLRILGTYIGKKNMIGCYGAVLLSL